MPFGLTQKDRAIRLLENVEADELARRKRVSREQRTPSGVEGGARWQSSGQARPPGVGICGGFEERSGLENNQPARRLPWLSTDTILSRAIAPLHDARPTRRDPCGIVHSESSRRSRCS